MTRKIVGSENISLRAKRLALVTSTSLEILKQKRIGGAAQVAGQKFAKQFSSAEILTALSHPTGYLVAVKFIPTGVGDDNWEQFLVTAAASTSTIPIAGFPSLYSLLQTTANYNWLIPVMASSSVYLLTAENESQYLNLVKSCLKLEGGNVGKFFEILFLKEKQTFIDFRLGVQNNESSELRALYATQTADSILLELNTCISSVPTNIGSVLSSSLLGISSAPAPTQRYLG